MEPQREIGFAAIGVGYMSIGTALDHPIRMYELHNLTNAKLQFSIDGVDDHFPLPANGYKIVDVVSNGATTDGWFIGKGTSFYVKTLGAAPTSGDVYLCVSYGA